MFSIKLFSISSILFLATIICLKCNKKNNNILPLANAYTVAQHASLSAIGFTEINNYKINQNNSSIIINLGNGKKIDATIQMAGSWNNESKTFLWAWANESIFSELSSASKFVYHSYSNELPEEYRKPIFKCDSEIAEQISSFVNMKINGQGIYPAFNENKIVYLIMKNIKIDRKYFSQVEPVLLTEKESLPIVNFIKTYNYERYLIEKKYQVDLQNGHRLNEALTEAKIVYNKFWKPRNKDWIPNSLGWPSEFEDSKNFDFFVFKINSFFRVTYKNRDNGVIMNYSYDLIKENNSYKIVDHYY